uniref:Uncharacterized protein n=1 Tax=Knipowitschia caucasica TaxID=637954 RepID=A0AAV2KML3_KNICA
MGNDIAGGEVYPSPEVVSRPILSTGKDELAEEHPEMFSVCVLTRAQSKKLAEEQGDVDLCDSVLAPVFSGVRAPPCGRPDDHARTKASSEKSTTAMSPPLTSDALIGEIIRRKDRALSLDRSLETAVWRPQFGDRSLETAVWRPQFGDRSLETAVWTPQSGHRSLDTAVWTPQSGHRSLDTAVWTPQ